MAKLDISAMSPADRAALAAQLASFQERDSKLIELVASFKADLTAAGVSVAEAVQLLTSRGRAAKGIKANKPAGKSSADSTGAVPLPGTTYVHPETGETWTKSPSGKGAPKKQFVVLVATGKVTWEQLAKGGRGAAKNRSSRKKTAS